MSTTSSASLIQDLPKMQPPHRIIVAKGDGIGPEILAGTLRILEAAQVPAMYEFVEIGESVYNQGVSAGIQEATWDKLRTAKVFLKAPVSTPQGGGFKSLNVTIRKTLGLYANVRPCVAYAPYVRGLHPQMNVVVIRENEEDLYAGIEHRQTDDVYQCLKLITRLGCERIIRYAFEYAVSNGRKKVTCMTKDNIMKLTDGLFRKVFDEIGSEYSSLEKQHMIIDIGMAKVATCPERFDVIVTPNLYGDILSDVAAEVAGSVGLAGSANVGETCAMFEAIHGSAPDIAGEDLANPSGMILASVMMLVHIGQAAQATTVHNAWMRTIEDGVHTSDIYQEGVSRSRVGTQAFAQAVIERLGQEPEHFCPIQYGTQGPLSLPPVRLGKPAAKRTEGVDLFIKWIGSPMELGQKLESVSHPSLCLKMITSRGVLVWPRFVPETSVTDHWRCRFKSDVDISFEDILNLLQSVSQLGIDIIKTENLCTFDGAAGYSMGQGE